MGVPAADPSEPTGDSCRPQSLSAPAVRHRLSCTGDRSEAAFFMPHVLTSREIPPRWLKKRAAAEYAGIGVRRLVALAQAGLVVGFKDKTTSRGDWVFDRYSLDRFRAEQYQSVSLDESFLMAEAARNLGVHLPQR